MDGILVANEIVDEAHRCKKELLLFKVDFEKAFDSVDWDYLIDVMSKMGFPLLWRKWIKECIGTTTVTPRFPNNVNNTHNQSIQRKTGYHTTFKI